MIGSTVSHYRILEKLGEGGMGEVFLAEDARLERTVALKFLPKHSTENKEAKERFEREAKAAAALNHPNIVTIHEIGEHEGQVFIAMEYVEGRTLKELISGSVGAYNHTPLPISPHPLPITQVIDIAAQIASGLAAAHAKGIVHRDIKPQNILVDKDNRVKLLDFGLAKLKGISSLTKESSTLGTVHYMSPEQTMGKEVDPRTDIWSLGVVLYEMLTGKLPFKGDYEQAVIYSILNEVPEPPSGIEKDIPAEIERLVMKALQKEKPERYQAIADVTKDLLHVQKIISAPDSGRHPHHKRPLGIIIAVTAILLILPGGFFFLNYLKHNANIRLARDRMIPEIMRLADANELHAAFQLARKAAKYVPQDPILKKIWPKISIKISLHTDPPGADIQMMEYRGMQGDWEHVGRAPIDDVPIPIGFFRWKIEKQGYETVERASDGSDFSGNIVLEKSVVPPRGMVHIPGGKEALSITGLYSLPPVFLDDFLIDRCEVTNRQFKVFVDQGGYLEPKYWLLPFRLNGKIITWQEAMKQFRDATGRTGPATWELGTYPDGQEDYPVSGISWFEAAAYAEFVGKELPTAYHWSRAASVGDGPYVIPCSNFKSQGSAAVGTFAGLGRYGTYDMAGNVREWCWNQVGEERLILGGAWDDMLYMFFHSGQKSPFDRSPVNGFRCARYLGHGEELQKAMLPVRIADQRDYAKEKPVDNKIFQVFASLFAYEKCRLDPRIEAVEERAKYWRKEKITLNAGYNDERLSAYLFLPKQGAPPYQTVVLFPGAHAFSQETSLNENDLASFDMIDFLIRGGRAAVYPIYKSMYERRDGYSIYNADATMQEFREHILMWRVDLGRTLDYLETRPDIDHDRMGFCGSSLGAMLSIVLLAVEDRLQVGVTRGVGLPVVKLPPDIDALNFAPRVKIPFLMINGRYDLVFPHLTSQLPLFNLLGTAIPQKRLVLFDCGHVSSLSPLFPRSKFMQEVLDWLDQYLGPVKQ